MNFHTPSPHQPQQTSLLHPSSLSVLDSNHSLRHMEQPQIPIQQSTQGNHEQSGISLERTDTLMITDLGYKFSLAGALGCLSRLSI